MLAMANCEVDLVNGEEEDSDGDTVQAGRNVLPIYRRQPASILSRTKRVSSPASLEPRFVQVLVLRCNGNLDLTAQHQVHDLTRDRWYSITTLTRDDGAPVAGDWKAELQRVTSK
jgi:hypothetical protein